ncbi:MAG: hypothetical protein R3F59_13200 [Myxococcota bacterium]
MEDYAPGRRVVYRFTRPAGYDGGHRIDVHDTPEGTRLEHRLEMRARGWARLTWPLVYRPLHDALLEDALDQAEAAVTGQPMRPRRWSPWVRALRAAFRATSRRAR